MDNINSTTIEAKSSIIYSIKDIFVLFKTKLSLFVVFTAIISYIISVKEVSWTQILVLSIGGFCVTGASNALNQVLEKDYDKLMKRTADRPIASGRMTVSQGVLYAGIFLTIGLFSLATFNPIAALLGAFAVISYAFLYTPLKRYSPIAIVVGSIPGACPLLIGDVAASGHITSIGLFLFLIQLIWQFPHFLAIGWLGFEDYKVAGFKLIPTINGEKDPKTGIHACLYICLFFPITIIAYINNIIGFYASLALIISSIFFAIYGWLLYVNPNRSQALKLMLASLVFLAVVLTIICLEKLV